MSKQRKRVSLGERPAEQPAIPAGRAAQPEEPASPPRDSGLVQPDAAAPDEPSRELALDDVEASPQAGPGIESHPLFWFVLGGLTVGIVVLLGLLLMGTGSAAPAARPTATSVPAVRLATATKNPAGPVAPALAQATPTQPDIYAMITAQAKENESVPRISIEETKKRLDAGGVVVVDVRSFQSFTEKRIKGAINIPVSETEQRLLELPKDKDIILYCA